MKNSAKQAWAALAITLGLATQALAIEPGQTVDNFACSISKVNRTSSTTSRT
jgi:hypothetical protein